MKKFWKYLLIFVITVSLCLVSFVLVTLIPKEAIKANVQESAEEMYQIPSFWYFPNIRQGSNLIHNYPDPITLNLTYSLDREHPLTSIFLTKYYSTNKYTESVNLREKAIHDYEPNQEYYRYWHGNIVLIRPLLLLFSYQEIQVVFSIALVVLLLLITYQLWKRSRALAIIFFLSNFLVQFYVTFYCFEYIYMFLLSYLLSLISFRLIEAKKEKIYCFFLVGGILSNFLDFLTTETLVFTLPFLIIYYFRYQNKKVSKETVWFFVKSLLSFLIGYSLMWLLKWLILMIFFHQSPSSFLTDHLIERGINEYAFQMNFFSSIFINIRQLIPFCFLSDMIIYIILGILLVYFAFCFFKKKFHLREGILVLIALVPLLRYLVMFMHSYDHFFFTYRALLPSIMIVLLLLWQHFRSIFKKKFRQKKG